MEARRRIGGGRSRAGCAARPNSPAAADRVDIIGPGKDDARSLTRDHLRGCRRRDSRSEQGTLQYELKVPLARSARSSYAIDTAPGKTIGVGLETGRWLQQLVRRRPRRRIRRRRVAAWVAAAMGGRGGGGGGMGGGGRGGGGGGETRYEPPKPIKGWGP